MTLRHPTDMVLEITSDSDNNVKDDEDSFVRVKGMETEYQ